MTTTATTATTDRRPRIGFRGRVLGSLVLLVAGAVGAGLLVQRAVLLERHEREVESQLEQERAELQALATGRDPDTGEPFGGDVRAIFDTFIARNVPVEDEVFLTFVDGRLYTPASALPRSDVDPALVDAFADVTSGTRGEVATDAGPVRYLAVPLTFDGSTAGVFVVAHFLQGERDEIGSDIRVSAVVALVILLLATAVAWVVAGRLLRPVLELTTTAESISESDLSRRIPVDGDDEIARLASTFNRMLDRLSSAFATQRTFVDDAGHELRTPITIVRGHLELMGDDLADREATIALVTDELDRMARIVDDLLLLAKAEQPDFVHLAPVEAADLTAELLAKARALGDRDWRLDATATGEVQADRQRVTQAVLNLARNADDHTPPGGEVGLGSAWEPGGLRLWVRDTGPGVAPADRERIFERFARGSGRRRSDGAGLGLAIVRSVAEAHGGRVDLDHPAGGGATFSILLPGRQPADPTRPLPTTGPHDDTVVLQRTEEPTR